VRARLFAVRTVRRDVHLDAMPRFEPFEVHAIRNRPLMARGFAAVAGSYDS
jgi:hypothetical protein